MALNRISDSDIDVTSKDLTYGLLLVILALYMALIFIINPEKKKEEIIGMMASEIAIELTWPDCPKYPQDIDLWVMGPDGRPVSYGWLKSSYVALLRDDLGCDAKTPLNTEFIFSIAEKNNLTGNYVINVHFYSANSGEGSVPVKVEVKLLERINGQPSGQKTIVSREIILEKVGDEITVAQFEMDGNGNFVEGSITRDFVYLISRSSGMIGTP